jgi:hypothetical protein
VIPLTSAAAGVGHNPGMSSKKNPAAPAGRAAALERLKKAEAAVGTAMPLFSGKQPTPEQRQALKAAMEELAAASREVQSLGGSDNEKAAEAARTDLIKRLGNGA